MNSKRLFGDLLLEFVHVCVYLDARKANLLAFVCSNVPLPPSDELCHLLLAFYFANSLDPDQARRLNTNCLTSSDIVPERIFEKSLF